MASQLKNMLIGLFVVIGCVLIIGIILFIKPSVGDGNQTIKVRFANINGIAIGTPVTYAGQPIGEVATIHQVTDARQQAVNEYGQVYPYILTLKIDSGYTIFSTDEVTVQTQGLLGEKYVAIIPKPIKKGQVAHVITSKDVIYADSSDLLESAMNEISALSDKIDQTLNRFIRWIDKYGDDLGIAIQNAGNAADQLAIAVKQFNDLGVMQDVKDSIANIATTFGQLDQIIYNMNEDRFFDNLSLICQNLGQTTTTIAEGKGTLGKIIETDGLYLQIDALMTKANMVLNDINQYGILFQYNKEFQRRRTKLMVEANAIKSPKAFQARMNKDVDQINATLERMHSLTERFDTDQLSDNKRFKAKFAELMQQLDSLQMQVKMYNEELMKTKVDDE